MNFIFIIINFVIFILIRIFMIFRSFCLHDILLYYMSRIRAFFVGCNVLIIIIIIIIKCSMCTNLKMSSRNTRWP